MKKTKLSELSLAELQRKRQELKDHLTKTEEKLALRKKVLAKAPLAVLISDTQKQKIIWLNSGIALLFNNTHPIDDPNSFFKKIIVPEQYNSTMSELYKPFENNTQKRETLFDVIDVNGKIIKYMAVTVPYNKDQNISGAFCINDISRRAEQLKEFISHLKKEMNELKLKQLTKTELKIAKHIAQGKTITQIADIEIRSYHTIEKHKRNIMKKMNFSKISEIVSFAIENGIA